MDTLEIALQIRPCDLNSMLNGRAAHKWPHANKEIKERVWARLEAHAKSEIKERIFLVMTEVQRFIDLECDDLFYKDMPAYIVQAFTTEGLNRTELRQEFTGPGAYQRALWYARHRLTDSARVTITTQTECEFKG